MIVEKIEGLAPALINKINQLKVLASAEKMIVGVNQGYRSIAAQDALYAQGRTTPGAIVTKAKGGSSWHNFGLAADVVFIENDVWSWSEHHNWARLGELGQSIGLEWGGAWKSYTDRPHFQLIGSLTLVTARRLLDEGGLAKVWLEATR